jgi:hypothetical protein
MTEKEKAALFSRKIDEILAGSDNSLNAATVPYGDTRDLETARLLTGIDLSDESRVRQTLKERLLGMDAEASLPTRLKTPVSAWTPLPVAIGFVILIFVLLPSGRQGGRLDTPADGTAATAPDSSSIPDMRFRPPEYLPPGYSLHEVAVSPNYGGFLVVFTNGQGSKIELDMVKGGSTVFPDLYQTAGAASPARSSDGSAPGFQTQTIGLGMDSTAWLEYSQGTYRWNSDGFAFTLRGPDVSRDEAAKIARSLNEMLRKAR